MMDLSLEYGPLAKRKQGLRHERTEAICAAIMGGKLANDIAITFSISRQRVHQIANANGLMLAKAHKGRVRKFDREAIAADRRAGLSIAAITERHGCSCAYVHQFGGFKLSKEERSAIWRENLLRYANSPEGRQAASARAKARWAEIKRQGITGGRGLRKLPDALSQGAVA